MRLVAVVDSLDPGGAETSLVETLGAASESIHATIVTLRSSEVKTLERRAEVLGLERVTLGSGRLAAQVRELRRVVRYINPDVVHSSLWLADLTTRVALTSLEYPLVTSLVNETYADERLSRYSVRRRALVRLVRSIDRVTARRVTLFHAVNHAVESHYRQQLGLNTQRLRVAYRGRDPQVFRSISDPERARIRRDHDVVGQLVVAVGRLEPQKDFVTLIEAVSKARASLPGIRCFIAGRFGSDYEAVRGRIRMLGLDRVVELLGHREDVSELLAVADCVVSSSIYEGTAGSLIEAMLCGTPVVATDLPGVREISRGLEGVRLVPVGDSDAMAQALEAVMREPVRPDPDLAASRFGLKAAANGLVAILREAATMAA